jgi:hypothetical protein
VAIPPVHSIDGVGRVLSQCPKSFVALLGLIGALLTVGPVSFSASAEPSLKFGD